MPFGDHVRAHSWSHAILIPLVLAFAGCGGQTPTGPDPAQVSASAARVGVPSAAITISGWVYETTLAGEPPIPGAVIEVTEADGATKVERTADDGSYRVSVRPGSVTITASKDGYESKTRRFLAFRDTALNLSLEPLRTSSS